MKFKPEHFHGCRGLTNHRFQPRKEAFADISEQQLSEAESAALVPVSEFCGR